MVIWNVFDTIFFSFGFIRRSNNGFLFILALCEPEEATDWMQKFTFYALFIVDILCVCVCVAWNNFRIEPRNLQLYIFVFDFGLFFRFGSLLSQKSIKMDDERLKAPDFYTLRLSRSCIPSRLDASAFKWQVRHYYYVFAFGLASSIRHMIVSRR